MQLAQLVEREPAVDHLATELLGAAHRLLLRYRPLTRQQMDRGPVDPAVAADRHDPIPGATALGHVRPGPGPIVVLDLRAAAQRVAVDDLRGVRRQPTAGRRRHRRVQQLGRLPHPADPGQGSSGRAQPEHLDVQIPEPAPDPGSPAAQGHRAVDVTLEQQQHLTADPVEPSVLGALGLIGQQSAGGGEPAAGDRNVASRKLVRCQG